MKITRVNHPEQLDLQLEDDSAEAIEMLGEDVEREISDTALVLCGISEDRDIEGTNHIWVDPNYDGQLSPGQWQLYQLLRSLQETTVYTVTTIGKLAEKLELGSSIPCYERLANLQSLDAIHGFRG